jgi:hypothetical protein
MFFGLIRDWSTGSVKVRSATSLKFLFDVFESAAHGCIVNAQVPQRYTPCPATFLGLISAIVWLRVSSRAATVRSNVSRALQRAVNSA